MASIRCHHVCEILVKGVRIISPWPSAARGWRVRGDMTLLQEFVLSGSAGLWGLFSLWYWTRRSRRQNHELQDYLTQRKESHDRAERIRLWEESERLWAETQIELYKQQAQALAQDVIHDRPLVYGTLMPISTPRPRRPKPTIDARHTIK